MFALQSHIEITRDQDDRWTFKLLNKPTKDAMISPLIKKLIVLVCGGPPTPQ
ncbi:MAG: hypothetical protein JSU86_18430 [Phycisphaerales bacterium]|nr:MAG: hypothetical protein JSU86_18430 [Phycisphaerales bacterium]